MTTTTLTQERTDLLEALRKHRDLFRVTVRGLTDEQARLTPTVSTLSLGGLVKHVTGTEREWADFIVGGAATQPSIDWEAIDWSNPPSEVLAYQSQFQMGPEETLAGLLEAYAAVAAATDELVATVDLDAAHPLPEAPWFEPGSSWSARRVIVHLVAEKSMG
jgi:uncharacterized damage-inducible protein DinB